MKLSPHQKSIIDIELNNLRSVMLYDTSLQILPLQQQLAQPQTQPQPHTQTQTQPQTQSQTQPQTQSHTQPIQTFQQKDNQFRPALNQDPLFWCLYIMIHGKFKYEQLPNRFTAEQDIKRDQIMMLRERAKQLKQSTGIKFTASAVEADIMSQRISLHAFQVLVYLNSLNAVFVNHANNVYAEFISDAVPNKPIYIIERNLQNPKQMTMTQVTETQLDSVRTTNYLIENPQKPMKSSSAYTVPILTEMCRQLKIQLNPKMKKQELYDAISTKLVL